MEGPHSPVLSCKKAVKRHNDLTASPILSCKRPTRRADDPPASPVLSSNKRKKLHHPGKSPVFPRSSSSKRALACRSPEIDDFSSPTRRANLAGNQHGLRPRSLFPDIEAPSLQYRALTSCQLIEDGMSDEETSDDTPSILEKTLSDEDVRISDATGSSLSNNSASITQGSSFPPLQRTPPKECEKKAASSLSACLGSSRKKNMLLPNGMAKQLTRLIARQETDFRLWKFQLKLNSNRGEDRDQTLVVRLASVSPGLVHCFAHCRLVSGDACTDDVCLVFTNHRWEKFNLQAGDVVSINEPWQSVLLEERQVTLLLGFNLIRKRLTDELPNRRRRRSGIEDVAPRRPCSSRSDAADSVAVAENKRPSSVLQTWTCPSQGCSCHFRAGQRS